MSAQFRCVSSCGKTYYDRRALTTHQASCPILKRPDQGREDYQERIAALRAQKRRRLRPPSPLEPLVMHDGHDSEDVDPHPADDEMEDAAAADPTPDMGRGLRKRRPTWKILENLPQPPAPVASVNSSSINAPTVPEADAASPSSPSWTTARTPHNIFHIFREYRIAPTSVPDEMSSLEDVAYTSAPSANTQTPSPATSRSSLPMVPQPSTSDTPPFAPFENWATFLLMNWMLSRSNEKSLEEMDRLQR